MSGNCQWVSPRIPWPFNREASRTTKLVSNFRICNRIWTPLSSAATLAMLWQLASITTCSQKNVLRGGTHKKRKESTTLGRTLLITIKTWLDQVCWSRDRLDKDHCAITRNKHTQAPPSSDRDIIFPIEFLFVCAEQQLNIGAELYNYCDNEKQSSCSETWASGAGINLQIKAAVELRGFCHYRCWLRESHPRHGSALFIFFILFYYYHHHC